MDVLILEKKPVAANGTTAGAVNGEAAAVNGTSSEKDKTGLGSEAPQYKQTNGMSYDKGN